MNQFKNIPQPTKSAKLINISSKELKSALLWLEDMFDRCGIPFMLVGENGKAITQDTDPSLIGDKIEVVVLKKYINENTLATLSSCTAFVIRDNKMALMHNNVPVDITIVEGDYSYFQFPDTKFYGYTVIKVPNPFKEYWENKDNIV